MARGQCRLTGVEGNLIKCHLYPKSFYKNSVDGGELRVFDGSARTPFKRSQTGLYDEGLVIAETEAWFQELDDYAFNFLKPYEAMDASSVRANRTLVDPQTKELHALRFDEFDFNKLTFFILSVLWRFAASTRDEADGAKLGPHFDYLHEALRLRDLSKGRQFKICISKLTDGDVIPVMMPYLTRIEGVQIAHMVFGGFVVYVKCDWRAWPYPFSDLQVRSNDPLWFMVNDFKSSNAYAHVVAAGKAMFKRYGDPWGTKKA